jgi:hypothetical protein
VDPWREAHEMSALRVVIPISKNRGEPFWSERESRSPADRAEGMQQLFLVSFPLIQWRQCGAHEPPSRLVPVSLSSAKAQSRKEPSLNLHATVNLQDCHQWSHPERHLRNGCFRGLLLAIALECSLALWIYAIWCL